METTRVFSLVFSSARSFAAAPLLLDLILVLLNVVRMLAPDMLLYVATLGEHVGTYGAGEGRHHSALVPQMSHGAMEKKRVQMRISFRMDRILWIDLLVLPLVSTAATGT